MCKQQFNKLLLPALATEFDLALQPCGRLQVPMSANFEKMKNLESPSNLKNYDIPKMNKYKFLEQTQNHCLRRNLKSLILLFSAPFPCFCYVLFRSTPFPFFRYVPFRSVLFRSLLVSFSNWHGDPCSYAL